jgi:hypothetical protein
MNKFDDFDIPDDVSLDDIEFKPLDINEIKQNLHNYSSQKLCEMVVCDRYFGSFKEIGIICMEELANRRIAGDSFLFEQCIEDSFNELPVLNLNLIPDLGDILRKISGKDLF